MQNSTVDSSITLQVKLIGRCGGWRISATSDKALLLIKGNQKMELCVQFQNKKINAKWLFGCPEKRTTELMKRIAELLNYWVTKVFVEQPWLHRVLKKGGKSQLQIFVLLFLLLNVWTKSIVWTTRYYNFQVKLFMKGPKRKLYNVHTFQWMSKMLH